ncbi:hypothetical protein UFOVP28_34 [uncultured Caudovirales phage]|uniref:Uncharacterized protein n=1 Tax=uncultured Caudovirales phage TaxID=2100421 RepID=A0A6J5KKF4_9CAUD|nr:hypothetical protein UFOVP28_34 [uncultured Caudovirales phage]
MSLVSTPYGFKPVRLIGNRYVGGALPTNQYRIKQNYATPIPNGSPVVLTAATTFLSAAALTSATYVGNLVTIVFAAAQTGLFAGMPITVSGITGATALNGTFTVQSQSVGSDAAGYTTFTYTVPTTPTGTAVVTTVTITGGGGFLAAPTNGTFNTNGDKYVGIFVGCQYTNAQNGQPQWDQWYPGNVSSANMVGYVIDDPDAVFQVQCSTSYFDALSAVGSSYGFTTITAGFGTTTPTVTAYAAATSYNSLTKDSLCVLDIGGGTSTTKAYKIVDISQTPDNVNDVGFVDVFVTAQKATHVFTKAL